MDSNGRFKIEGVAPGTYRLVPNLGSTNLLFSSATVEVDSADVTGVEIEIEAVYSLDIVASQQGVPVPGLVVTCTQEHDGNLKSCECTTNEEGRCRIEGLASGEVKNLRPTFSGSTAQAVTVPSGKPVHVFVPALGGISGEVVTKEGNLLPWRIITAQGKDGQPIGPVISDAKGRFQLGSLVAGVYSVQVYGYDNRSFSAYFVDRKKKPIGQASVTLSPGELATGIRIQAAYSEGKIAGRIVGEDGQPQPSALVTYVIDSPRVRYGSLPVGIETTVADDDGTFSFDKVDASYTYRVFAQGVAGEQGMLKEIAADGTPVPLVVRMPAELRVRVSGMRERREPARILVKNEKGIEETRVVFPSTSNSGSEVRFPGIEPGDWIVKVSQGPRSGKAAVLVRPALVEEITVSLE